MKYLEGFRTDIYENISQLKEQTEGDSTWLENYSCAVNTILEARLGFDSASSLVRGMSYFSRFTPQNTTYMNLVNSGSLSLIKDYDLRQRQKNYQEMLTESKELLKKLD